jgi:predicted transcriptional regulator
MRKAALGAQELEVLRYIGEHGPLTVGEITESFGQANGLARTTLATVMERLRGKGYLTRTMTGGIYRYAPAQPHAEQIGRLVRQFVENSLGGDLDPVLAYLASEARLTVDQLDRLRVVVEVAEPRPRNRPAPLRAQPTVPSSRDPDRDGVDTAAIKRRWSASID